MRLKKKSFNCLSQLLYCILKTTNENQILSYSNYKKCSKL